MLIYWMGCCVSRIVLLVQKRDEGNRQNVFRCMNWRRPGWSYTPIKSTAMVTKYLVGGEYWILFLDLLSCKSLVKNDCYLWTCKKNRLNHQPTNHQQPVDASKVKFKTLIHHNGACHKSQTAHNSTTNVLNEPNLAKHLLFDQNISKNMDSENIWS